MAPYWYNSRCLWSVSLSSFELCLEVIELAARRDLGVSVTRPMMVWHPSSRTAARGKTILSTISLVIFVPIFLGCFDISLVWNTTGRGYCNFTLNTCIYFRKKIIPTFRGLQVQVRNLCNRFKIDHTMIQPKHHNQRLIHSLYIFMGHACHATNSTFEAKSSR